MSRRDAVQFTLEWAAEARRLGAEVTFEPGWETRGNGMSADFEGLEVHHTGFGSSEGNPFPAKNTLKLGRPDLGGPLTNVAGPWCPVDRPRLHVVAAHPSNNAGASGKGSKNLGPLPLSLVFNKYVFALEIDYGGNVAMAPGQRIAALIFSRAGANVLRRSTEYVRAHAETSVTGKWDPGYAPGKTIDMAAFRRDAAHITAPSPEEDDMPRFDLIRNKDTGEMVLATPGVWYRVPEPPYIALYADRGLIKSRTPDLDIPANEFGHFRDVYLSAVLDAPIERNEKAGGGVTTLRAQTHWADYNLRTVVPEAVAKVVGTPDVDALATKLGDALTGKTSITRDDVKAAVQEALREGTGAPASSPAA